MKRKKNKKVPLKTNGTQTNTYHIKRVQEIVLSAVSIAWRGHHHQILPLHALSSSLSLHFCAVFTKPGGFKYLSSYTLSLSLSPFLRRLYEARRLHHKHPGMLGLCSPRPLHLNTITKYTKHAVTVNKADPMHHAKGATFGRPPNKTNTP